MKHYFWLQRTVIERHLRAWGLAPWLVYTLVPLVFVGGSLLLLERSEYAAYAIAAGGLSPLQLLGGAERNRFLNIQFLPADYCNIRLAENGAITLPFVLLFLATGFWALALVQALVGGAMAFLNGRSRSSFALPTPFSRYPFEFAIGARQWWPLLLIAAFLLVMGLRADNFELSAFAWFVTVFTAMAFYQRPEPGFYVWVHTMTGKQFLIRKLFIGCGYLFLLGFPFVLCLFLFFSEWWLIVLLGQFIAFLYLSLMITIKYTAYPQEISLPQGFVIGAGIMLPPLLLVIVPYYFSLASRRVGLVLGRIG